MPIIKERGGKLRCKSNGVDTKVDPWKDVELEWLRINPRCDRPSKTDDQMIYIEQKDDGIFIVNSSRLSSTPGQTMHEKAWRYMNNNRELPMDSTRPVAGLSARGGTVYSNSGTFNEQDPNLDSVVRSEVADEVVAILQQLFA